MFDCVRAGIRGCILADDMGLGKTLCSRLLCCILFFVCQGFDGKPAYGKKGHYCLPPPVSVSVSSTNREAEIKKWVGFGKELGSLLSVRESTREGRCCFWHQQFCLLALAAFCRLHLAVPCPVTFSFAMRPINDQILTNRTPIICGREPTASAEEKKPVVEHSGELSGQVNQFILRRTNALLSNHLPPKI